VQDYLNNIEEAEISKVTAAFKKAHTVKKLVRDFTCRPISGKELLFLKYGSYF